MDIFKFIDVYQSVCSNNNIKQELNIKERKQTRKKHGNKEKKKHDKLLLVVYLLFMVFLMLFCFVRRAYGWLSLHERYFVCFVLG